MDLGGQGARIVRRAPVRAVDGYAMAALLVSLGVMAVLMSAALPVWRHQAQREKEAELIFRGEQYARAIGLYQRKMGPGNYPPSIDILVQQRFLRKKYKDPMVADGEFQLIPVGGMQQAGGAAGQIGGGQQIGGRVGGQAQIGGRGPQPLMGPPSIGARPIAGIGGGPIMGVVSKSKEASIRVYRGLTHYNQWQFIGVAPQPGGGGFSNQPGMPGIGGRGRGQGPGGVGGGRGQGRGQGGGRGPGGGRGFGPEGRGGMPFPGGGGRGPGD